MSALLGLKMYGFTLYGFRVHTGTTVTLSIGIVMGCEVHLLCVIFMIHMQTSMMLMMVMVGSKSSVPDTSV